MEKNNSVPHHKPTLKELGISREEALAIRYQFGAMTADWDDPEMDAYDDEELNNNPNIVFFHPYNNCE